MHQLQASLPASADYVECQVYVCKSTTTLSASHHAELEPLLLLLVAEALTYQPSGAAYLLAVVLLLLLEPALQHMHRNQTDASQHCGSAAEAAAAHNSC
jgi:hypothetical protein